MMYEGFIRLATALRPHTSSSPGADGSTPRGLEFTAPTKKYIQDNPSQTQDHGRHGH